MTNIQLVVKRKDKETIISDFFQLLRNSLGKPSFGMDLTNDVPSSVSDSELLDILGISFENSEPQTFDSQSFGDTTVHYINSQNVGCQMSATFSSLPIVFGELSMSIEAEDDMSFGRLQLQHDMTSFGMSSNLPSSFSKEPSEIKSYDEVPTCQNELSVNLIKGRRDYRMAPK